MKRGHLEARLGCGVDLAVTARRINTCCEGRGGKVQPVTGHFTRCTVSSSRRALVETSNGEGGALPMFGALSPDLTCSHNPHGLLSLRRQLVISSGWRADESGD